MPDRVSFLKRAVSFHNQAAFTSEPSTHEVTINKEIDEDLVSTKTLAIVLVGLPARGKTHLAGCLERYLNWLNFPAKTFNVEQTRRKLTGGGQSAEFFDPNQYEHYSHRMRIADRCLSDMLGWFESGGNVGIFDATNTTVARRLHARSKLEQCGARVLFLESICNDQDILEKNFAGHKLRSPDYTNWEPEEAARDFEQRIGFYEDEHEDLREEEDCSYIKIINAGQQIIMNEIRGYLQGKIVSFLLNSHIGSRTIYLSRHGQSIANLHGKLGGDPSLTQKGRRYSFALADFMRKESDKDKPMEVWTSQVRDTLFFSLNELN